MLLNLSKSQQITKNVVYSKNGVVSSQHRLASKAGADILEQGGNAIDAAIATSFALGVVEPWMSGPGGGGYMVLKMKDTAKPQVVNFGMQSSSNLNPNDYPIDNDGIKKDLFAWPPVKNDRNLIGGGSVAVPGVIKGMGLAHKKYAKKSWESLLEPAIRLAKQGLRIDWYTQLIISASAADIANYKETKKIFLTPSGHPKSSSWTSSKPQSCELTMIARFLESIAHNGSDSFYTGDIANQIAHTVQADHGCLTQTDLEQYSANCSDSLQINYKNCKLFVPPEMTAGQSLGRALNTLSNMSLDKTSPSINSYVSYAQALMETYSYRLQIEGDLTATETNSCTSHFSIIDKNGNVVAATQTLLSIFGSKLVVPELGFLLNNGNMWFDPEQGKPNSIGPGKRCLSNMCPVIGIMDDQIFAIGAAGGRKILPAVFQLISFLVDYKMPIEKAFHMPRIDVSGGETVTIDDKLTEEVHKKLSALYSTQSMPRTIYPHSFAIPSAVSRINDINYGITEITSPLADSVIHN